MTPKETNQLDKFHPKRDKLPLISGIIVVFLLAAIGTHYLFGSHAASSTELSLSSNSQSISTGSDTQVTISLTAGTSSVLSVQSVLSYNPSVFSFISATAGPAFTAAFPYSPSTGQVSFTSASVTPITSDQTVAIITLKAIGSGSSTVSLANVCANGNFTNSCSAAWDSVSSNNDLGSISSGITYKITGNTFVTSNAESFPTTPTNVVASASAYNQVNLSWTASTDVGGSGVAGYNILRSNSITGPYTAISTATNNSFQDKSVVPSTKYYYQIQAFDSSSSPHTSPSSTTISIVTPNAPASFLGASNKQNTN